MQAGNRARLPPRVSCRALGLWQQPTRRDRQALRATGLPLPYPPIGSDTTDTTMAKRAVQTPLVCHGHTRPIVELNYS